MTIKDGKLSTYEIITLVISAISLSSLVFLIIQTRQLSDTLESTVLTNISSREFDMNSIFVEHPDLQPYFFSDQEINAKDRDYPTVVAIARARLNFISTFYEQSAFVQEFQNENSPTWQAWKRYIKRIFSTSPIMCLQLEESRDDYTPDFVQFVREGCAQ